MANGIKLGILIPTRNRASYLNELLGTVLPQSIGLNITVYVRDNNSSDNTEEIVKKYQSDYSKLIYHKNEINIGGDANFLLMIHKCTEDYFWLFGDDEILLDNALPRLMTKLQELPDYIVLEKQDKIYSSLGAYVSEKFMTNPYELIYCTLITANIVKKSNFDINFATTKYATHYGHMYSIAKGLSNSSKKIMTCANDIFRDRGCNRAVAVDGDWPECLELEWDKYLKYLADINGLEYPWFKICLIDYKRRARNRFGAIVSLVVGKKIKRLIQKYILGRNNIKSEAKVAK